MVGHEIDENVQLQYLRVGLGWAVAYGAVSAGTQRSSVISASDVPYGSW
jgi:hypothetical protein